MHLLDLVAQGLTPPAIISHGEPLPDARRYRTAFATCPIRYVLTDELARCATEMAFADGDRLSSCLDLIRVPARTMWVEWTDRARQLETLDIAARTHRGSDGVLRAGAFLTASVDGRSGTIRSFWSTRDGVAFCSPMIAHFDFEGLPSQEGSPDPVVGRGRAKVTAPEELGLDDFLEHLSFRFDEHWAAYYRRAALNESAKQAVLRASLGACAFDPPMVFAFLLMLSARGALPCRSILNEKLNRARHRSNRPPLLEHVLVTAPFYHDGPEGTTGMTASARHGPRRHHVCGHIVRRGSAVFWRAPHLRGNARLGTIRSRTVKLSFAEEHVSHSASAAPAYPS